MIKIDMDIIKQSIDCWGKDMQTIVCMEEMAEGIQACSKILRYGADQNLRENMKEEIADICICLEILKEIYEIKDENIQPLVDYKQKRTAYRMKNIQEGEK